MNTGLRQTSIKWIGNIILLLAFISCKKDNVVSNQTPSTTQNPAAPTRSSNIIDKSPQNSSINSSTNSAVANKLFPGFYITLERASQNKFQINERSLFDADYRFWDPSKCYLDYNKDGFLDMFAFLTNFKDAPFGSRNGKIILVDDVFGSSPKIKVYDANRKFSPRLKAVDLNNDGVHEVLFSAEEDHALLDGTHGTPAPFQLAMISPNGDITFKEVGEKVSIHGQTFGDVDKDGDIDILVWRNAYTNPNNQDLGSIPILYLNNGANTFTQTNSFTQFLGLASILPILNDGKRKNYPATVVDLFDVDGDGNLDILVSYSHNRTNIPSWEYGHNNTRIYWGNGTGFYEVSNTSSYVDLPVDYLNGLSISSNINVSTLGFSYIDFDKDGDIDILTTSTPDYGGHILQLCENVGSRKFKDVTKERIDIYSSIFPRNSQVAGTFPNFYDIRIYDKDGDGDYDIVPDHVATWGIWQFPIAQHLYWENNGGFFKLKK